VWPSLDFIPRALDIVDSWAIIAGYGYSNIINKDYSDLGCLINLADLTQLSCVVINNETTYIVPSDIISFNDLYEMSVAICDQKILIGIHRLESVIVLVKTGISLTVTNTHTVFFSDSSSFGRGVAWVDNTTFAVLTYNSLQTSGSKSIIFVYNENSVNSTSPLYTFPNNQQIMGIRLLNPFFARLIITAKGNMVILTTRADILIIPIAPIGYTSTWIGTSALIYVFQYVPLPCIGGTHKNISGIGPCQICPPRTRNPGTLYSGANVCIPCSDDLPTSFCPRASLIDIDSSIVPSYSQAIDYPETSDTTDIEDILSQNVFQIGSELRCMIISPLFWTSVVGVLCLVIGLVMILLKRYQCITCMPYRNKVKRIFKHTDIIGEGELWFGGLATLAIIVLVAFSYWFSASFIQRYPIEQISESAIFACNPSLINTKFSTGLQLLALPKSADSQPIFTLLDQQKFQLTIELINTGFMCNNITAQENFIDLNYVRLSIECTRSISNAITSVTFPLPSHYSIVQINMTGPHWIGGIRLCIRGNGLIDKNSTLRELDFCEFYSTPNQTIGRKTVIPIIFVKNINMTHGFDTNDVNLYSGLWIPTFSSIALSDEVHYADAGNYLRYTSSLTVIQVTLDERPFFIKNIQEPIVRKAELIFHSLLFTSLCIELFAFMLLLMKLCLVPVVRWTEDSWKQCHNRSKNDHDSNETGTASYQTNHTKRENSIWQTNVNQRDSSSSDFEITSLQEITVL
jgi:hypothetical protein